MLWTGNVVLRRRFVSADGRCSVFSLQWTMCANSQANHLLVAMLQCCNAYDSCFVLRTRPRRLPHIVGRRASHPSNPRPGRKAQSSCAPRARCLFPRALASTCQVLLLDKLFGLFGPLPHERARPAPVMSAFPAASESAPINRPSLI